MRYATLLACTLLHSTILAPTASAGCISDPGKARYVGMLFATSRVCPGMVGMPASRVSDFMQRFGAVSKADARQPGCANLTTVVVNREWGRLAGMRADAQRQACVGVLRAIRSDANLAKVLRFHGILK